MKKLTEEQKSSIKYFWEEYDNIERYSDFEKIKPQIQEQYPELLKAWHDYKVSIKIMNAVLDSI